MTSRLAPDEVRLLIPASERNLCAFWDDFDAIAATHISSDRCEIRFSSALNNVNSVLVRGQTHDYAADGMVHFETMISLVCDLALVRAGILNSNCKFIRARTKEARRVWGLIVGGDPFCQAEISLPDYPDKPRYLALRDGQPVAACALVLQQGVAGLYCVRTLPRLRGQGLARSLVLASLLDARDHGYRSAVTLSSVATSPMYEKFGFKDLCRYEVYTIQQR